MKSELPYHKCQQELQDLLKSRYPLIFVRSSEENRAIRCIIDAHLAILNSPDIPDGELAQWNSTEGFQQRLENAGSPQQAPQKQVEWQRLGNAIDRNGNPILQSLDFLQNHLQHQVSKNLQRQHTYLLPDWSVLLRADDHLIARKLKELIVAIDQKRPVVRMSLIIIGADWNIPTILRNMVHIIDLPLPVEEELYENVFSVAVEKYGLSTDDAWRLAEQAQGMPLQAAIQAAKLSTSRNLWHDANAAAELLLEAKKQEIRKTGVLEYYAPSGQGLNDVGGLTKVKEWIYNRECWFTQDRQPELRPRAILLEGFPGCGKTFIARAIAQEWHVPQINFEISRLQSRWVGESESNTFQALKAIEASAPNILFMDEIEKAFAGVGGDSSGVSTRQFGTFLSWLNDHEYPIFFIATSNDREKLPPELFRAGRFDEIFIVMPPNTEERYQILQKRTMAYKLPPTPASILEYLVEKTPGYSGAELDKLVKEAIYLAEYGNIPNKTNWENALTEISPQYRTPNMQKLLRKYLKLIEEGGGKSASELEMGFLENLIT
ncbi:AAA family ATPase [Anabaena sp. FACHB-1237]|uniref:AAA family ATPase n=1 Tax=Anabaena sp. FACHB-1237 TaxID=2692769 RepID=UPI00168018F4|nr:AAA family ATPase [Anabaena sp. FACHB-1237]MBD2136053.1 AAA family ATPase [Anabaena sp. FACHB-1237]